MTEQLNEDFLIKRIPIKSKKTTIVKENLGDIYTTTLSNPYSTLDASAINQSDSIRLKLSASADGHIVQIKQGEININVANDKFVVLTKGYMAAIFADLERLKRICAENTRQISHLNSKVDSLNSMKNRATDFQNRIPPGAFKDGGNN